MNTRNPNPKIVPLITERWSPRSFDGRPMRKGDLDLILEAATWAPSAFNLQPWRFLYAERKDEHWDKFLSLLLPFNAQWAENAAALVCIVSDSMQHRGDEVELSHSHSFDAGAAWAMMALQATALGYHAHAMSGLDLDRARIELAVPSDHRIEAAVAIGRKGPPDALPKKLRAREFPSLRKSLAEVVNHGGFA